MILIRGIAAIVFACLLFLSATADARCTDPIGRLAALQGQAEVRRAGETVWKTVHQKDTFCPGDLLRIAPESRAAVVLENETVLRLDQNSTVTFGTPERGRSLLNLLRGALHIFSHRPRALQVITPYVNGTVEGTEFLVTTDDRQSRITVFSGLVIAANRHGRLDVGDGQTVLVRQDSAPIYEVVIRPRDAVQWTLYYPPILTDSSFTAAGEAAASLRRAATALAAGRADDARNACTALLADDPDNSQALSLLAIIELARNNRQNAEILARRAWNGTPRTAAAGLALSYARQAAFDIDGARAILMETATAIPDNPLVLARLAELQLAAGARDDAVASAHKAVQLAPEHGLARVILGFAHLARVEIEQAEHVFNEAITRDQLLPLARLGLGLARIRGGAVAEGRADIELAAALDPGNSLIRSYLGKAYFEERRNNNARRQYLVARELDPADPTPWFYDAIRKQSINRPIDALHDLQQSIDRNDRRAVYRSRLLLDDDLAARSASLGRIYQDLGFEQLALAQGRQSLTGNPANYSAHRFLADSYHALPRHEIARVSELLQSQLLQPLNLTPVQPQLAESNLAILDGAGPAAASFHEFNPLFLRNRMALQASGVAGSNDSFGDELTHAAIWNRWSYSLGQFHYSSDGFRENNEQTTNLYNAFLQTMLSPSTSLLSELRFREKSFGDLALRFDPQDYQPRIDQSDDIASLRIGARHDLAADSTLLGTAVISSTEGSASGIEEFGATIDITNDSDNGMAEIQHLYRSNRFNLQSGAGYLVSDETEEISLSLPIASLSTADTTTRHLNAYSYAQLYLTPELTATIGLSGDLLDSPVKDREELNPKLGVSWQPLGGTTIRGAVFKNVQRRLIYAQTIEPTQVAGFNQLFDDFAATSAWTYGLGIDQSWSDSWFAGLQVFRRELDVPFPSVGPTGMPEQVEDDWREDIGSAYLYWTPCRWAALGLDYYYERFSHDRWEGPQGIAELTTHRITPKIHLFHQSGWRGAVQASYLDQHGDFGSTFTGFSSDSDRFWLVDLSVGYRLPNRRGIVSLEVKNLFDETFRFLDTDPAQPRLLPERQFMLRLTVSW
jgi:cytochrome c-type biogenesis protein CcmH/NrfG